mmetsp:Transcript_51600/g.137732  ORF Transcript_51600/g.137732 Transcript_51600/m.137732 type:complete len:89 (+) Transcript_51600:206-472(+)
MKCVLRREQHAVCSVNSHTSLWCTEIALMGLYIFFFLFCGIVRRNIECYNLFHEENWSRSGDMGAPQVSKAVDPTQDPSLFWPSVVGA